VRKSAKRRNKEIRIEREREREREREGEKLTGSREGIICSSMQIKVQLSNEKRYIFVLSLRPNTLYVIDIIY